MPRMSRAIAVGYPHHVTQRGNYRQTVFGEADDYARYLKQIGTAPVNFTLRRYRQASPSPTF